MKNKKVNPVLTACELFAGVGGFRLALENEGWKTVWANQWEPGRKTQHAYECYLRNFASGTTVVVNQDISNINKGEIPDHSLLVGGFPCQDYSVATTKAKGIEGIKGVLWWEIYKIIRAKKPTLVLLENVDRLLKSPSKQKGRDFAIILKSLDMEGYDIEWLVVNSADYGSPQRRKRIFILACRRDTAQHGALTSYYSIKDGAKGWSVLGKVFPSIIPDKSRGARHSLRTKEYSRLAGVSKNFSGEFFNWGVVSSGEVFTNKVSAKNPVSVPLKRILEDAPSEIRALTKTEILKFEYMKGAKRILRKSKIGNKEYYYSEGRMVFPDESNRSSRTMLTSEGTVNRSSHVVIDNKAGKLRYLTPVEAERLNGFPDGWTAGMPDRMRYFCMGNALVVPLVQAVIGELRKLFN